MKCQVSSVVPPPFAVLYLFVIALFLALVIVSALFGKQVGLTVGLRPSSRHATSFEPGRFDCSIDTVCACVRVRACLTFMLGPLGRQND